MLSVHAADKYPSRIDENGLPTRIDPEDDRTILHAKLRLHGPAARRPRRWRGHVSHRLGPTIQHMDAAGLGNFAEAMPLDSPACDHFASLRHSRGQL